ncbi:uncharacterized protein N7469_001406 [Penicillium citrinum]|uniref:Uncharacterized protein n=1 Tax=Penicillium citrinum TaxID=5077 RepID=A0A9W9PEG3_PENCI|nr:uncharacterized protein N7469_001406 [Penicillium citrinum]KAJ5243079.1 hypothetical protein N7469_001406 [Penicillium citrinum]KAK5806319.1 hypothetical protein VI817_000577 [Penicillium citrinum]
MICAAASLAHDLAQQPIGPCLWCQNGLLLTTPNRTSDSAYQSINGVNAAVALLNSAAQNSPDHMSETSSSYAKAPSRRP